MVAGIVLNFAVPGGGTIRQAIIVCVGDPELQFVGEVLPEDG